MSLVPWPAASAQTTATRCCHDGTPSTAKMPVKNINNAFVTTLLLKKKKKNTRTVTARGVRKSIMSKLFQHLFDGLLIAPWPIRKQVSLRGAELKVNQL